MNNVGRIAIGQYNNGQSSTNNQTVINSAGTGAVVLNGSNNSGTGGVTFGSGGTSATTVATINNAGNAQFNGTLLVGGTSQSTGTMTVRNNADAEVDYYLWPGLTTSQKGSYTYKDWNGNSQWYMVKDASNNWALNSATGGLDSFKAYQNTNSGDTYINASNSTGHIRLNYETGSGAETDIYSGSSTNLDAAFLGPTSIKFPGLAATSGRFCLQVDTSGYMTNTGAACGTGSGSGGSSGTINSGNSGQIAYYAANGTTIGGMNAVPVTAGGTGATSASGAMANLLPGVASDGNNGIKVTGNVAASELIPSTSPVCDIRSQGAVLDGATDIGPAVQACVNQAVLDAGATGGNSYTIFLPCTPKNYPYLQGSCYWANPSALTFPSGQEYKFLLQGSVAVGSTLVADWRENWFCDSGSGEVQFQPGPVCSVWGPSVNGTIGTAISTIGSAVTLTPTFTSGAISNLPPGSAVTVAETKIITANATRTVYGGSIGKVTLTLLPIATPGVALGTASSTGGTVPGSTYNYAWVMALDAYGNRTAASPVSAEVTTTGSSSSIAWTWTAVTNAASYELFVCNVEFCYNDAGSSSSINYFTSSTNSFTQTVAPSSSGAASLIPTQPDEARFLPQEILSVTGCVDSSFDITGGAIQSVDYSAAGGEQVVYVQTDDTPATSTGCRVTSFDDDKFESDRIFCSNGVNMSGYSYSCGAGQITIVPNHTHASSAQWGEVAVSPAFATYNGQTWKDISIQNCYGMCFWQELGTNMELTNVSTLAGGLLTSGAFESTASWTSWIHHPTFLVSGLPQTGSCASGGCTQPSYPYAVRCDGDPPDLQQASTNTGCAAFLFDGGGVMNGGFKIDDNEWGEVTALPSNIDNILFEEVPGSTIMVDNRKGVYSGVCLMLENSEAQDNLTIAPNSYIGYTDSGGGGGCFIARNLSTTETNLIRNKYMTGSLEVDPVTPSTAYTLPVNDSGPSGIWSDGVEIQAPIRGSGANFGPAILPFGSLAINNSPSYWTSQCGGGCSVVTANVSCPDGPQATSAMQCAELDYVVGDDVNIPIGSWTGTTYAGDQFIYGCYVRPGANESSVTGLQNSTAILLQSGDAFANGSSHPGAFGTSLENNTWYPWIGIATIQTPASGSHTVSFYISPGSPGATAGPGYGNQFSNCRWAFIPGPNNPSYAGVTQDEVMFARDNQYRGAVPSNMSAGVAATEEPIAPSSVMGVNAGVFTNTQMNQPFQAVLNSLKFTTEYQTEQGTGYVTDGFATGVQVPSTSSVFQSDGVAGYIRNNSPTTNGVGGYFQARGGANNAHSWGLNSLCSTLTGYSGQICQNEFDLNNNATSSTIFGLELAGTWSVAPAVANGFVVAAPGGSSGAKWSSGFISSVGCCTYSFFSLPISAANSSNSAPMGFESYSSAGVGQIGTVYLDSLGNLELSPLSGTAVIAPEFAGTGGPIVVPGVNGLAAQPTIVTGGAGSSYDLNVKNVAGTHYNLIVAENGTVETLNNYVDDGSGNVKIIGQLSNANGVILPSWLTGYNGSGTRIPLVDAWNTPSTITAVCHDATGTLTDASCPGGTTTNSVTFNNGGSGASSGASFNGSSAVTISYNTIGAQAALNLAAGTYTNGDLCTYTASGILLNCNTAASGLSVSSAATATAAQTRTTFTTSTASVSANTCNSTVQVAMTGASSTSVFLITPNASTASATGWGSTGGLILTTWGTSGYFNYQICNQTSSTISSPGAVAFNVAVF